MPRDQALLTFAIPFYSNLPYLKRAIDSVFQQSNPLWHIIVCDDGNKDESAEKLVCSYPSEKISYYRNTENLGLAGNWNRCLSSVETPLVTLLHSDDELQPQYAETMIKLHRSYPDVCCYFCRTKIVDKEGREIFSLPDFVKRFLNPAENEIAAIEGDRGLAGVLKGNYIMCPTLCYNRFLLGEERFDGSWKMVLDLEFIARLLLKGLTFLGTPEICYSYRRHNANQTSILTASLKRFEEEVAIYHHLREKSLQKGWTLAAQEGKKKNMIKLHLLALMLGDLIHLRWKRVWVKTLFFKNSLR